MMEQLLMNLRNYKFLIYICLYLEISQKMLNRSASGPLARMVNMDYVLGSLSQKDKTIRGLQKQVQRLAGLKENYQRLKDRKIQMLEKCQSFSRQIVINRDAQEVRQDTTQKRVIEMKMMLTSLQSQLQNKQNLMRDLQCETDIFYKTSDQKQNQLLSCNNSLDTFRSNIEVLRMEAQRLYTQITQMKEQVQKKKQNQYETDTKIEKIRSQIQNTQTSIRKLTFEESTLSQSLSSLQVENNSLDENIEKLIKICESTNMKIKNVKEEKEQLLLKIKRKQLEKGRISTQFGAKLKQYKVEKEKEKSMKQVSDSRKLQSHRIVSFLREVNEERDELIKQNCNASNINDQLRVDLKVCKDHLQNVNKVNHRIKQFLQSFMKTNTKAIKKLKKPGNEESSERNYLKDFSNMGTGEGFIDKSF